MTATQNILALIHEVAILFPVFLCLFTFRGFFLAFIANFFGDTTARDEGYLTLNPFVHINLMNLVILMGIVYAISGAFGEVFPRTFVFLLLATSGAHWIVQSPTSDTLFRRPKLHGILYGFAASIGYFIIGFFGFLLIKVINFAVLPHYVFLSIVEWLRCLAEAAIFFGAMHLIPLPPMHAARILYHITSQQRHEFIDKMYEYETFVFLGAYLFLGVGFIVAALQLTVKALIMALLV